MFLRSLINIARLKILFFIFLITYPVLRRRSIYLFLDYAGPSFIKLGQALASRPDLIGKEMAASLSGFQDKVKPFSSKIVKNILAKELGHDYEERFTEIDYTPAASASIAQVHKATLNDGSKVAVKILRPNIRKTVKRDIATLGFIIKITSLFSKSLAKSLDDIASVLKQCYEVELDLTREAGNAVRLKKNLVDLIGFYVPDTYPQLTTPRILVTQWIDGIPFSDLEAIKESTLDKKEVAKNLVISYFSQVYRDGYFHADMHHGNLFLMANGDIGVVDFGIMCEIDKKLRIAIAEILIAYLDKNYARVAKIHIEAGIVPKDADIYALELTCKDIGSKMVGSSIKDVSLARLLTDLIEMTSKYKMSTKPELLLLQKTILLVEGVGVTLDPDLNIWKVAGPWVKGWAVKNISFDAKIRDAAIDFFTAVKNIVKSNL